MRTPRLPAVDWTDAPHRFKWTRPFRGKKKSGFCACAITPRTSYTTVVQDNDQERKCQHLNKQLRRKTPIFFTLIGKVELRRQWLTPVNSRWSCSGPAVSSVEELTTAGAVPGTEESAGGKRSTELHVDLSHSVTSWDYSDTHNDGNIWRTVTTLSTVTQLSCNCLSLERLL